MADPIKAAEESERLVACLNADFRRRIPNPFALNIGAARPRQPTLHERYCAESRGDQSFGAWLEAQGLA